MKLGIRMPGAAAPWTDRPADRRKRWLAAPVTLITLIAVFSLGVVAPAATAAEPSTDAVYTFNFNGQTTTLTEGETATYAMQRINSPAAPGQVTPNVVYTSDAGTLTVTASAGVFHYSIAMSIPATTFIGSFRITDITSGLSGGSVTQLAFTGNIPTSKLYGHRYSGSLTGTAFFFGVPVATVVPNYTLYVYL